MRITDHPTGAASWVDLATSDVEAARAFYGDLFGWEAQADPGAGGYAIFNKDGAAVCGVGPLTQPDQPIVWSTYFATDNADATATKIELGGGKTLIAPFDVMGQGRMGIFMDPAGAAFGIWQKLSFAGAQVKDEAGSIGWVELMTREPETAARFYGEVLGWTPKAVEMLGSAYTIFWLGDQSVGGMMPMTGDQWPVEVPAHWMVYFEVDDCDASVAKAEELGGLLSVPATTIPGVGRFAVLGDPTGAYFSIIASEPRPA
jgi:predicted enzyme related to lactoylglutathione lyase